MHPSERRTPVRYLMAWGAIIGTSILAATVVFGNATKQAPSEQATVESAPLVRPAIDGVLDLFKQKAVVALGDAHGVAQEEIFYSALIRDPRFAEGVGNVVVEFGEASQGIIDHYVAGENVPLTELRRVWTETAGWVPGPTALGYINFFANVRAVNLKLPPEHRIKVWLGDPKIDWSIINSFQDLQPYLERRDENFFRIISVEILKKHKKTLLVIGSGHLDSPLGRPQSPEALLTMLDRAYPNDLVRVAPFIGYIEPACNAKVVARAKDWPVPAVVSPVEGTWLKAYLQLPGCSNIPGANFDAVLFLGSPDTLTQSPIDPDIYLDPDYFNEENRRLQCCTPGVKPMDWGQLVQRSDLVPKKLPAPQFIH
jgi:hypothetical protein